MIQRFEDYIKDYDSNFSELSKYASSKGIGKNIIPQQREVIKKFFDEKDDLNIIKFAIRYYRTKKEMYNSSQMLIEEKRNKEVGE